MEHRNKRPRLSDAEGPTSNSAACTPSTEPLSATSTMADSSTATTSAAPDAASETMQDTSVPLTTGSVSMPDKLTWQGWAEIENDPIIFNVMLREWGVRGIQVTEVVPLDAIFDSPPASTFGLIFLSRYTTNKKENQDIEIPHGLWFANQTSTFSCATVALMNILSNIENINLGPEITQFITATSDMSSKDKGLSLDSFEHIRKVHNSFATLIDMKFVDRSLREDARAFAQRQKQAAKKPTSPKSKQPQKGKEPKGKGKGKAYILSDADAAIEEEDSELGFHFTAYIPSHNHLWRMDGLQRQPESLGTLSDTSNWLDMAVAELSAQWVNAAENNIEFSLLSLVAAREDEAGSMEETEQAGRMREDWGPALAELVRGIAESGRL